MKVHSVRTGPYETQYLEAGEAHKDSGPPIVLIHDGGFGGSAQACWSEVIPLLAKSHYVLAPDMLGWGGSSKAVFFGEDPYGFRIRHIGMFLEQVGVGKAHFVGTSFGGSLTLRGATTPGTTWAALSATSITGAGGLYRYPEAIEALADFASTRESIETLTGWLVPDPSQYQAHQEARYQNSLIPGHWEAMSAPRLKNPDAQPAKPHDPFLDNLAATTVPLLLIEGSQDRMLEPGWAEKLAALSPTAKSLVLEAGHEPNIDAPGELAAAIVDFIA